MAQEIKDVSPPNLRFVQTPHTTFDLLEREHALGVYVLGGFLRHTESYNITLQKLIDRANGVGEALLSKAYNAVIRCGLLVRVEFGHTAPTGTDAKTGARSSTTLISKVPLSPEQWAAQVREFTPGKHCLVPWPTGTKDANGREIYEKRRVRVLSAEVYSATGAYRLSVGGEWELHPKPRGAEWKRLNAERLAEVSAQAQEVLSELDATVDVDAAAAAKVAAQKARTLAAAAAEHAGKADRRIAEQKQKRADRAAARARGEADPHAPLALFAPSPEPGIPGSGPTRANTEDQHVGPEPGIPGSGPTRANTEDQHVGPEPGIPGSIKNTEQKLTEKPEGPRKRGRCALRAPDPGAARPELNQEGAVANGVTTGLISTGDHPHARTIENVSAAEPIEPNPSPTAEHPIEDPPKAPPAPPQRAAAAVNRQKTGGRARTTSRRASGATEPPVVVDLAYGAGRMDGDHLVDVLACLIGRVRHFSGPDAVHRASLAAYHLVGPEAQAAMEAAAAALLATDTTLDGAAALDQVRRDTFERVAVEACQRCRDTPNNPAPRARAHVRAAVQRAIQYAPPVTASIPEVVGCA